MVCMVSGSFARATRSGHRESGNQILQWLSANIGYHHIHHLSARVPNYNLERCHQSHPLFRGVKAVTLFSDLEWSHDLARAGRRLEARIGAASGSSREPRRLVSFSRG